jgi:hypothetical protein
MSEFDLGLSIALGMDSLAPPGCACSCQCWW